jgi:hypothetical protein
VHTVEKRDEMGVLELVRRRVSEVLEAERVRCKEGNEGGQEGDSSSATRPNLHGYR